MAQIVINGELFSPVPAHQLEPGDKFTLSADDAQWRVQAIEPGEPNELDVQVGVGGNGSRFCIPIERNRPVLRMVGGRAARGGAR